MKGAVSAFLAVYVVAVTCSAQVLSQETKPAQQDGVVKTLVKDLSKEVSVAGELLVAVAKTLGQIDLKQDDEYFLRDLWEKAVEALKKAGEKIKEVVNIDVKTALQDAAEGTKQKAKEKALEILAKIVGGSIATYAADDLDAQTAFLDQVCNKLDKTGKKLIAHGVKLSNE